MIFILIIMFIGLIFNPSLSFNGALHGLVLWSVKVLPALFPAMLLTSCIIKLLPVNSRFAYIYIIVCGLLCGYPIGAFACGQLHLKNPNEKICENILGFCNISGTAFVINYIYTTYLYTYIDILSLLLIIYIPPALLLIITLRKKISFIHLKSMIVALKNWKKPFFKKNHFKKINFAEIFNQAVNTSVENALKLGGYIIFFSCVSEYCKKIFSSSTLISCIITGIIEITNGIALTASSDLSAVIIIIFVVCINAFGGISTIMQTCSVISEANLSIKKYIYQKLLCTIVTLFTAIIMIYVF